MHRDTGAGQVVVAHRLHAHHREQPRHGRQLLRGAQAHGAVALLLETLQVAAGAHLLGQRRVGVERAAIDPADQIEQLAVQRHLALVHGGHGQGETPADLVRTGKGILVHRTALLTAPADGGRRG
ncbi:hypothetical protein D3C81_1831530 [compost metagenome]